LAGARPSDAFDNLQSDFETLHNEARQPQDARTGPQNGLVIARTLADAQLRAP
jgi:hypothetical protein